MIRSLWVAKTGMDVNQSNLDVIANNLANASTTAFKRVKTNFEDLLYQTVRGSGSQTSEQTQSPTGLNLEQVQGFPVPPEFSRRVLCFGRKTLST